jgi:ATP-binding cassette subfamily B protein
MRFFSSYRIGEIVSRYADAGQIRYAISNAALTIMIDTVMAAVGGAVLYAESSRLFFVATILLVIYATVVFVYNKPIRDSNEEIMEDNAQVTSYLVESLKGIETIKAFNGERHAQYETEKYFVRFLKSVFHNGMISNSQQALTATIAAVGEVVILWMGTIEVLDGKLSIGQLITFNVLLSYFLTPVQNLINLQPIMQTAFVAADRLSEFLILSSEKDDHDNERLKNVSLCLPISISHVDFRFGTRDLVLRDINMKICAGERVALVGESGSGKSTLVKLLMRFFDWEKGEIYFGDYNIKDINLETIRDKIAYISQDVFLFSGTIRQNLCLGNENVPLEDIIQACKLSCAHEFIEKLPKRYDTILEENGANLSGGQKQRLAIARALLKKPDIMIMDEATSNLDLVTEKAIDQTINGLPDTMTTIIIAHRLSTIMNVDKIYVLREGRIIEYGDHQKLISNDGYYAHLWQEQARMNKGDEKQ